MSHTIPFMPWYPSDFRNDVNVLPLTRAQRGIYRDLLDLAWMSGDCSVPDSFEKLSLLTGKQLEDNSCSECADAKDGDLRKVLELFIAHPTAKGKLTQKRLLREWEHARERYARRACAGAKGGSAKKGFRAAPHPPTAPAPSPRPPCHDPDMPGPPTICPSCGGPMFSSQDRKGEAFSKCQNHACVHKGVMWYPDGSGFNPKTKKDLETKDGMAVEKSKKRPY